MATLKKLPLGISVLRDIISENYIYIDKTEYAYKLLTGEKYYFLSRPRRFGKSLFVSTLEEVLSGHRELFSELWIGSSDYHWQPHGVIKLDFSQLERGSEEGFKIALCTMLQEIAQQEKIDLPGIELLLPQVLLSHLVGGLYTKYGRVAVLIDEYDAPLLHNIHDIENAKAMGNIMQGFFAKIKGMGDKIKFTFLTGISSFARAGIFSGMNNLKVLTLDDRYAGICGYTDEEIDTHFNGYIEQWAQSVQLSPEHIRVKIREWYNGYRFGIRAISVYNPFSLLNAFDKKDFDYFWIASGVATFLMNELRQEYRTHEFKSIDYHSLKVHKTFLYAFDIGAMPIPSLLFQAGYLTIAGYDQENELYTLTYPNHEVGVSLRKYLLEIATKSDSNQYNELVSELRISLNSGNSEKAIQVVQQLFSRITYYEHEGKESYYHSILQVMLEISGLRVYSQYATSHGRIDLVVEMARYFYIIEVKFGVSAEKALEQIISKKYHEPFEHRGKKVILLGIAFNRAAGSFVITSASKDL